MIWDKHQIILLWELFCLTGKCNEIFPREKKQHLNRFANSGVVTINLYRPQRLLRHHILKLRIVKICIEPFAASSSSWFPCSMMSPSFMTRIRSASRIVDSRWAMTKLVLPSSGYPWLSGSRFRFLSTDEVASSRIRILLSARIARAIVSSCFCPCDTIVWHLHSVPFSIAARQGLDEVVGSCGFCCCDDFLICCIEPAVADVFHDGSLEQPRILQDHTEGSRSSLRLKSLMLWSFSRMAPLLTS